MESDIDMRQELLRALDALWQATGPTLGVINGTSAERPASLGTVWSFFDRGLRAPSNYGPGQVPNDA